MNTTQSPVKPDEVTAKKKARAKRRAAIVRKLPSAAKFIDEVSDLIRRGARGDPEEVKNDLHIADSLDRFIDYLLLNKDIPPPPPAQVQPPEQAKAS